MNELVKTVTDIVNQNTSISHLEAENSPKFNRAEQIYIQAKKTPVLAEMKENEIWNECNQIILKTFHNLNKDVSSPPAIAEMKKLTQILRDLLLSGYEYRGITTGDLNLAFDKGVRGDYGKFYGLNLTTFNEWIKSYENEESRISALKKQHEFKLLEKAFTPEKKELTDKDFAQCVLTDLQAVKSGGFVIPLALLYDWLYKKFEDFKPIGEVRDAVINTVKARILYDLKEKRANKCSNSEKINRRIVDISAGKYDDEFFNECKKEHYKTYLINSSMLFEKKIEKMANE